MEYIMIVGKNDTSNELIRYVVNDNNLGRVVAIVKDEEDAEEEILFYNPDILFIDYDLKNKTGINIVRDIRKEGFKGKIIIYTNKKSKEKVIETYNLGVHIILEEPLYEKELVNIIKNLQNSIYLEKTLTTIKKSMDTLQNRDIKPGIETRYEYRESIKSILSDIGIIGETGTDDLILLIEQVMYYKDINNNSQYLLQVMYEEIAEKESDKCGREISPKTIEQRIRRIIQKALSNICELGLDDFSNEIFSEYSNVLFEFKQVRQEMNFIKKQTSKPGKINIRKFIEGVILQIKN